VTGYSLVVGQFQTDPLPFRGGPSDGARLALCVAWSSRRVRQPLCRISIRGSDSSS
jgi:hypothetical protein